MQISIKFILVLLIVACTALLTSCRSTIKKPDETVQTVKRVKKPKPPKPPIHIETNEIHTVMVSGDSTHIVYHEGRERYFLLHIPPRVISTNPSPVLLVLHGGGGTPEDMLELSGFNTLADRHDIITVYPSGSGSTPRRLFWNILLSETYATVNNVDDIGFIREVLDQVGKLIAIDTSKIFAAGFSQGGMMCYRLACDEEFSKKIAAIAVVGATMTVSPEACAAARPVPVISFHGREDPFDSFQGGIAENAPRNDLIARPGVAASIHYWVRRGGLAEQPTASGTRGTAELQQFGPDSNEFEVVSWVLQDGGHTWPGSNHNLPEWMMGKVNRDIDATALIWDFFSRHPLR